MCSHDFINVNGSEGLSAFAGAYSDLGADKRGSRVFFKVLAPFADAVYLVGSFNFWSESNRLEKNEFGVWQTSISTEEIKDGDQYKFKVYSGEKVIYLSDPYANETDGEPYFNSVYRENSIDDIRTRKGLPNFKYPFNIYEIEAGGWLNCDGKAVDFEVLSRELLPYVLQMGYSHVSISGVLPDQCDLNAPSSDNMQNIGQDGLDRETAMRSFVCAMRSAYIGVFLDWKFDGPYGKGTEEIEFCARKAIRWLDSLGIDGFVVDHRDIHSPEFFSQLVHTVKSERRHANFIVRTDAKRQVSFADTCVMECGAYRPFFRQKNDTDSYLRMNAASIAYLVFKEGKMLTRMGFENGYGHATATFRHDMLESDKHARFQFFFSELSHIYLSVPSAFGCGDGTVCVEMDYGGIRVIQRRSDVSELIFAVDFVGEGGEIILPFAGEWNVILDSNALLGYGCATVRCESRDGVRICLPPYGAVALERIS